MAIARAASAWAVCRLGEPFDHALRDARGDGLRAVERKPRHDHPTAAPVGVEELRAARRDVDLRDLDLREPRGPERALRAVRLDRKGSSARSSE